MCPLLKQRRVPGRSYRLPGPKLLAKGFPQFTLGPLPLATQTCLDRNNSSTLPLTFLCYNWVKAFYAWDNVPEGDGNPCRGILWFFKSLPNVWLLSRF